MGIDHEFVANADEPTQARNTRASIPMYVCMLVNWVLYILNVFGQWSTCSGQMMNQNSVKSFDVFVVSGGHLKLLLFQGCI